MSTFVLYFSHGNVAGGMRMEQSEIVVILVVEDESLVQELVSEALSEGGFKPEIIGSGEQAVRLLERDKDAYRALVTDIHLSGNLTGWDVAKRAREINPDIPVIYMTGAAAEEWPANGVPCSILLNKPFAPAQIVTAVANLLNQTPPLTPHQ
jgi:CheY-like chemotaxis protein